MVYVPARMGATKLMRTGATSEKRKEVSMYESNKTKRGHLLGWCC
jgi:hypothetical protein